MNSALLTIGDEVTSGEILNRNSQWLAEQASLMGSEVVAHMSVRDREQDILDALGFLSDRAQLLFLTGGLGPTTDDITRQCVAKWCGCALVEDQKSLARIAEKLKVRGVSLKPGHHRQATFPRGAKVIANSVGTADGFVLTQNQKHFVVLPGPPKELQSVWENGVAGFLEDLNITPHHKIHYWRCEGIGESDLAEIVEDVFSGSGYQLGYRASKPQVIVKLWVPVEQAFQAKPYIEKLEQKIAPYLVT